MDRTAPTYSSNAIANSEQKVERQAAQKIIQKGDSLFSDVLGEGVKGPDRFITKISSKSESLLPPFPTLKDNALNAAASREIEYHRRDSAQYLAKDLAKDIAQDNAIAKAQNDAIVQRQQNECSQNECSQAQDEIENAQAQADRAYDRLNENIREQQLIQEKLQEAQRLSREQAKDSDEKRQAEEHRNYAAVQNAKDQEKAQEKYQQQNVNENPKENLRENNGELATQDKLYSSAQYNSQQNGQAASLASESLKNANAKATIAENQKLQSQVAEGKEAGRGSAVEGVNGEKITSSAFEENAVNKNALTNSIAANSLVANSLVENSLAANSLGENSLGENSLATDANANAAADKTNGDQLANLIREESIDVFELQNASKNAQGYSQLASPSVNSASEKTATQETSVASRLYAESLQSIARAEQSRANAQAIAEGSDRIAVSLAERAAKPLATASSDTIDRQQASDVLKANQPSITRAVANGVVATKEASLASSETSTVASSLNQNLAQNLAAKSTTSAANNLANSLANSVANGNLANAQAITSPTRAEAIRSARAALANSNLPDVDIQTKTEVKAHNPEAVRLSGANAFTASAQARAGNSLAPNPNSNANIILAQAGNQVGTGSNSNSGAVALSSASPANLEASKQTLDAGNRGQETRERLAGQTLSKNLAQNLGSDKNAQPNNHAKNILNYLASRLASGGGRNEALNGNRAQGDTAQDAGGRSSQASLESRFGQSFSSSSGSNSDTSSGNAFSQGAGTQSLSNSVAQRGAAANSNFATASSFVREQVFVNIQRAVEGKVDSMTVKMRPEMLGRIEIRLDGDGTGRLQILVLAERSETLDLLQRDSRQLEQALQEAGIRTQDKGLQFGLQGQGKQDADGDNANNSAGQARQAGDEESDRDGEPSLDEEGVLSANIDNLQLRQDGRLDVRV